MTTKLIRQPETEPSRAASGNGDGSMEPVMRALSQLSPQSQEIAASLVRQLAER